MQQIKFSPWKPKGTELPIRFYIEGSTNGAFIGKKGGGLKISKATIAEDQKIRSFLLSHGIDIMTIGLTELGEQITANRLSVYSGSVPTNLSRVSNIVDFRPKGETSTNSWSEPHRGQSTLSDLYQESRHLDMASAPFKAATVNNIVLTVDTREPEQLYNLILSSKLKTVGYGHLPLADIQMEDIRTGDILLVERKTISDFNVCIKNHKAHDQAERYYDAAMAARAEGKRFKVIWIIESQKEGREGLYHALPTIPQVSGMISYLEMITDQSVFQSFGISHTSYLILKFCQAYFEGELYYKVKTGNPLVNRSKKDRNFIPVISTKDTDHGVTRASNSLEAMLVYLPSIRLNVARELAGLGKSYKDIVSMTIKELEAVKGVGSKSARQIFEDFNKSS